MKSRMELITMRREIKDSFVTRFSVYYEEMFIVFKTPWISLYTLLVGFGWL